MGGKEQDIPTNPHLSVRTSPCVLTKCKDVSMSAYPCNHQVYLYTHTCAHPHVHASPTVTLTHAIGGAPMTDCGAYIIRVISGRVPGGLGGGGASGGGSRIGGSPTGGRGSPVLFELSLVVMLIVSCRGGGGNDGGSGAMLAKGCNAHARTHRPASL